MFVVVRAVTYATLFIGLVLVFLPARLLSWSGVTNTPAIGIAQATGMLVAATGAALCLWCISAFALLGKGTPAPFDPPRHLVVRGPYKFVRNPRTTFGPENEHYCRQVWRWWPRLKGGSAWSPS